MQYLFLKFTGNTSSRFDEVIKKWKKMSQTEREAFRDEVNTKTMFSRCEEIGANMLEDEDAIDTGDFVICRFALEENQDYQHDHLAFISKRYRNNIQFGIM